MRIVMAQINPTVGDVNQNGALVLEAIHHTWVMGDGADVILFPEMCLLGYPHRDLILREGVVEACEEMVRKIIKMSAAMAGESATIIVGGPRRCTDGRKSAYNSAFVIRGGEVIAIYDKQLFPGYDVFDEDRYFEPGEGNCLIDIGGTQCAILICEDIWQARDVAGSDTLRPRVARDPVKECANAGCDTLLVLSASPFVAGKGDRHIAQLCAMASEHEINIVLVNQVGGNDDLVFDGRSVGISDGGEVAHQCAAFESDVSTVELSTQAVVQQREVADEHEHQQISSRESEVFRTLVLGIRDYIRKTGHSRAILGLSGGIDSALTAVLAVSAIGPENVTGVMMPSMYSSAGSIADSEDLARNLGITDLRTTPIERAHEAVRETMDDLSGIADENVQARLRCIILMAASNNEPGSLVLATGNKSELAMGYCTLYGDMAGALSPLGDLLKTEVYDLSNWINRNHAECGFNLPPIPDSSLIKPPSAELRPDQTDQDTLPPYDVLDAIIERYIDEEKSVASIISETGFDPQLVQRITRTIDLNEYKRRQAAIVLKVNPRTFGPGRPMPVAMKWRPGVDHSR